jgi:hypothetical protein
MDLRLARVIPPRPQLLLWRSTLQAAQTVGACNGFIPIVSKAPGFLAYDLVNTGHTALTTISTFEDRAGADHSDKLAEAWVKDNLESMITEPPTTMGGETGIHRAK